MNEKKDHAADNRLYADDVVNYIAQRHHTSPQELIKHFDALEKGCLTSSGTPDIRLEQNEIEMLRDLCATTY